MGRDGLKKIRFIVFPLVILMVLWSLLGPGAGSGFIGGSVAGFDSKAYDAEAVMAHIEELASPKYAGRQPGYEGNELALAYIESKLKEYGVQPLQDKGYRQPFASISPMIEVGGGFTFKDKDGKSRGFKSYKDYKISTNFRSGSVDYTGDVLVFDSGFGNMPMELVKDKVIILKVDGLNPNTYEYLMESGATAILYYDTSNPIAGDMWVTTKSSSIGLRDGLDLPLVSISSRMYHEIRGEAGHFAARMQDEIYSDPSLSGILIGVIPDVSFKETIRFTPIETANIFGVIPGKDPNAYLILSGHLDHCGSADNGRFYPGALDNASGTAAVLEMARWCASQGVKPEKTIIFAFFNAEENGLLGSEYYVEHPLVPLDQTEVINMDMVGGKNAAEISVISDLKDPLQSTFVSRLVQYGKSVGVKVNGSSGGGSDHVPFIYEGSPSLMLNSGMDKYHTFEDTIENIDVSNVDQILRFMGEILKREYYGDRGWDFLNAFERTMLSLVLGMILLAYLVEIWHGHFKRLRVLGMTSEGVHFSKGMALVRKALMFCGTLAGVFLLVFISQLPRDLDFQMADGRLLTNFSLYLTSKDSILYLRELTGLFIGGFKEQGLILQAMSTSVPLSLKLLAGALSIGVLAGTVKGLSDAYLDRSTKGFTSLLLLSVPEVLWIFCANILLITVANSSLAAFDVDGVLKSAILPLMTLAIMPTVYLGKVAYVAATHELGEPYVLALKARGVDRGRIFKKHLMRPVLQKVLASAAGLVAVLISNLIIVEVMFDYKGLANTILIADRQGDKTLFITLVICLCLLYVILSGILKAMARTLRIR